MGFYIQGVHLIWYLEELIPYAGLPKTQRMLPMGYFWSWEQALAFTFWFIFVTTCRFIQPPCDFRLTSPKNIQKTQTFAEKKVQNGCNTKSWYIKFFSIPLLFINIQLIITYVNRDKLLTIRHAISDINREKKKCSITLIGSLDILVLERGKQK